MSKKGAAFLRSVTTVLINFLIFFAMIGFAVTCSFLAFGAAVTLPEEDVRAFAPVVFFNVLLLSVLFTAMDAVRQRFTVSRPARAIRKTLRQLTRGDFSARVTMPPFTSKGHRFEEIADSVNTLAEELGSVETLRTDFIANVSHEMKTPLSVMHNYGTLLQAPTLSDSDRLEYAKAITDSSRRLSDLMTDILRLNRLENQAIYPETAPYDLGEQLCECLLQFETVWEQADITIETTIEDGVIVNADAQLLSLVWNNLLSNAFKFTEAGGTVSVSLTADDRYAVVQVSDTGCGMTPQVGAHIFEKFYQGDTSHATKGNGLGLALVKRVVDILRGEIRVQSVYGKGSTFTVKIRR